MEKTQFIQNLVNQGYTVEQANQFYNAQMAQPQNVVPQPQNVVAHNNTYELGKLQVNVNDAQNALLMLASGGNGVGKDNVRGIPHFEGESLTITHVERVENGEHPYVSLVTDDDRRISLNAVSRLNNGITWNFEGAHTPSNTLLYIFSVLESGRTFTLKIKRIINYKGTDLTNGTTYDARAYLFEPVTI